MGLIFRINVIDRYDRGYAFRRPDLMNRIGRVGRLANTDWRDRHVCVGKIGKRHKTDSLDTIGSTDRIVRTDQVQRREKQIHDRWERQVHMIIQMDRIVSVRQKGQIE